MALRRYREQLLGRKWREPIPAQVDETPRAGYVLFSRVCTMHPDAEGRRDLAPIRKDSDVIAACSGAFEADLPASPEPVHGLPGGRKPGGGLLEDSEEFPVEVAPESFRPVAAIMPKKRQNPAVSPKAVDERLAPGPSLVV